MKSVISCVLLGGLGNQLFQISTVLSYSNEFDKKYVLGIIPVKTDGYPFKDNDVKDWGGHPVKHPIDSIENLGDVFPKLNWITNIKKYKNLQIIDVWLYSFNQFGN